MRKSKVSNKPLKKTENKKFVPAKKFSRSDYVKKSFVKKKMKKKFC